MVGPHHANRNVGLALQQVADGVAHHQRHLHAWQSLAHGCQHIWQQVAGHRLAGGNADGTRHLVIGAVQLLVQLQCSSGHLARRCGQRQGQFGGFQPTAGALEQHGTQLLFQLGNLPAYCGLAGAQLAGRTQQTATVKGHQKGLHQPPVKRVVHGFDIQK